MRSAFRKLAVAVVFLIGLGSAEAATTQGVTPDEIVIGALGALTGGTAFIGGPGRDGIQLAVDKINEAGGIGGRKLRLIFEHAFTPAESVAAAKKLVEQDKVFVLILASGSTGAAAAADYVRETGVPTYNLYGATPVIRNPFAKNVFHGSMPDGGVTGQALVDRALEAAPGAKKIGVLAGTYAFPQTNLKTVEPRLKAAGVEPVIESFEQNAKDYTAQLLSFARQKVKAVIVLGSFTEAGYAIKQAPEKGLTDVNWVLDGSAVTDAILPIIGPDLAKKVTGYSNSPYFINQPDPAPQKFKEIWVAKYGQPPQGRPNLYDMVGYGGTYVLAQAIEAAGSDLTWEGLVKAWSGLKDARPSKMGGLDVIFPESFSETDHQGNRAVGKAVVKDGMFQVVK